MCARETTDFFSLRLLFRMPSLRQHPLRHETRWTKKKVVYSDIDTEHCVNDIHIRNGKTQWKRKVHTSEIICLLTHSAQPRENKRNANRKISERTHSHRPLYNDERGFQLTEDKKERGKKYRERRFRIFFWVTRLALLLYRSKYLIYSIFNLFKLSWKHSHLPFLFPYETVRCLYENSDLYCTRECHQIPDANILHECYEVAPNAVRQMEETYFFASELTSELHNNIYRLDAGGHEIWGEERKVR